MCKNLKKRKVETTMRRSQENQADYAPTYSVVAGPRKDKTTKYAIVLILGGVAASMIVLLSSQLDNVIATVRAIFSSPLGLTDVFGLVCAYAALRFAHQDREGTGQGGADVGPFIRAACAVLLSLVFLAVPHHFGWHIVSLGLLAVPAALVGFGAVFFLTNRR